MAVESKILELRDSATCIPVIAVCAYRSHAEEGRPNRLLRHAGYAFKESQYWIIDLNSGKSHREEFDKGTFGTALQQIALKWTDINDGDVIECGFISGREPKPQGSDI